LHTLDVKEIRMARKTANGKTGKSTASPSPSEASSQNAPQALEDKVVALAEQMGRLIGTVQAKAEGWLDPQQMRDHLTRIQADATDLLAHLTPGKARDKSNASAGAPAARSARGRSGGKVDAPGKKHRPPPPSQREKKPSNDRVAKLKASNRSIRRPRRG
jgi:hypothetical protein